MRKIEVDELRKIQMDILDYVAEFCDKNGIRYWITSGTLLGAVRHKGFIPWDDDMDVGMLRADYELFTQKFNEACAHSKFKFHCVENDMYWHLPFGKVIDTTTRFFQDGHEFGINIDVFPYDDVPDDQEIASKMYRTRDILKILNAAQRRNDPPSGNFIRRVLVRAIRFILHRFPEFYFIRQISRRAQKYNGKKHGMIGNFTGESKMKPCDKTHVLTTIDAPFEDRTYKIPVGYDQWLRGFYGDDYMQIPPEEKRKHHTFEAYMND